MFIEVTDATTSKTRVINSDYIHGIASDGAGAHIAYLNVVKNTVELLRVTETYAALKTTLGI